MSVCRLYATGIVVLYFIIENLSIVVAEICTDGSYCHYPKKCCSIGCCSIRTSNNDRYLHSRTLKYTVWNVWYFWFILIFILMACFGGCGYYRKKRMMITSQRRSRHSSTRERTNRIPSRVVRSPLPPESRLYAYTGPAVDPEFFPPPYSEVVSKPDLYPVTKDDPPHYSLQPYTGQDAVLNPPSSLPQPPPYSTLPPSPAAALSPNATDPSVSGNVPNTPDALTSVSAQQPAAAAPPRDE